MDTDKNMEIKKGKIGSLKGDVIVYARVIPGEKLHNNLCDCPLCTMQTMPIHAIYGTADSHKIAAKVEIPNDFAEKLINKINSEIAKQIKKQKAAEGIELKVRSFFAMPFFCDSEDEIMSSNDDVVYTGTYPMAFPPAIMSLHKGMEFYLSKYRDQLMKEMNLGKAAAAPVPRMHYTSLRREDMKDHILKAYVTPMMDAARYRDNFTFERAKDEFMLFCRGADFANAALSLCAAIEVGTRMQDIPIIDAHLNKVVAISNQDYIAAAGFRDTITALQRCKEE